VKELRFAEKRFSRGERVCGEKKRKDQGKVLTQKRVYPQKREKSG